MWTLVNVGSCLFRTFYYKWNHCYIKSARLLQLIWVNIRLILATECQGSVTTIIFTHVVYLYKFIINVKKKQVRSHFPYFYICPRKTLPGHMSIAVWYMYASLMPCSMKYCCNICTKRLANTWVVLLLPHQKGTSPFPWTCCSCHVHIQYMYYSTYKNKCTLYIAQAIFSSTVLHFVHAHVFSCRCLIEIIWAAT